MSVPLYFSYDIYLQNMIACNHIRMSKVSKDILTSEFRSFLGEYQDFLMV